ncbi:WXG100-like domain-containing protein, partial [Streptosporangium sandarakinum]
MAVNTDSAGSRTGTNPSAAGGTPPDVAGGAAPDVTPAWGESLPAWANTLISYLASGQNWPESSERLLWQIATANRELYEGLDTSVEPGVTAGGMILQSWTAPASKKFAEDFIQAYSEDSGVPALARQAATYFQQADDFAREVQYSKISINVAFWIAVIATYIALLAAFFSAGATTSALGPIAAAARSNIGRILQRLAVVAGRTPEGAVTRLAARGAATHGATAAGGAAKGLRTLLTGHVGREIAEEMGEEGAIDYLTQKKQMDMGTRTSMDWQRFLAAEVGAAGGAVIGMKAAPMLNRFSNSMPVL